MRNREKYVLICKWNEVQEIKQDLLENKNKFWSLI